MDLNTLKIPENDCNCSWDVNCSAKGSGLQSTVRSRRAHFEIYFKDRLKVSILIEIKGPQNTICCCKIEPLSGLRTGISFQTPFQLGGPRKGDKNGITLIPLWYQIFSYKISIYYIPLVVDCHKIRIFNHGLPLRGSPFLVQVYELDSNNVTNYHHHTQLDNQNRQLPRVVNLIKKSNIASQLECDHYFNDEEEEEEFDKINQMETLLKYQINCPINFVNHHHHYFQENSCDSLSVNSKLSNESDCLYHNQFTGSISSDSLSNGDDEENHYHANGGRKDDDEHCNDENNDDKSCKRPSVKELIKFWNGINVNTEEIK